MLVKDDRTLGSREQDISAKLQRMSAERSKEIDATVLRERAEFAERLAEFMHAKGWKSATLDRASGITKKTIDRLLAEETTPQPNTIERLAKAFDVSPEELLGRRPPPALGQVAGEEQIAEVLRGLAVIARHLGIPEEEFATAVESGAASVNGDGPQSTHAPSTDDPGSRD